MPNFDFSTLITDRTQADVDALVELLSTPMSDWTSEKLAEFNLAKSKGAYNYTDLNRVTACMDYLNERLMGYGYDAGYSKVEVPHGGGAGRLPSGYTELEYIESTGTQYVNTGVIPSGNIRVQLTYNATAEGFIIASETNWATNSYDVHTRLVVLGSEGTDWTNIFNQNITVDFNRNVYTDTAGRSNTFNTTTVNNGLALFLFCSNRGGTPTDFIHAQLIGDTKIYDDDVLVRFYVPCTDPSGEVGLYDLIGGQFYSNAGTGAFIAGPARVQLPDGYTQVEYIQSSGTQYVDTGILPDTNTEFEVTAWMSESGVNYATLFGSRDTEQCRVYYNGGIRAIFLGSATASIDSSVSPEQILNYKLNNSQFSVGDSVKSLTPTVNEIGYPIYIFGVNTSGSFTYGSQSRIYSFKIKQDGVFARNYVPCISNSDEVGLYDLVSASFFGNAGTGTFTAGPEVNWTQQPQEPSDELDPYTWYEEDTPTLVQMNQYLANVAAIRNVLQVYATTPETPADINGLTYQEANDIEMILVDVEALINTMVLTFVPCGPATCGGDYF